MFVLGELLHFLLEGMAIDKGAALMWRPQYLVIWVPPTKFCSFPSIARELLVQLSYVKLCCKELRQVLFVMMSVFALGMEVMTSAKCGALCCYGYLSPSLLFSQEYGLCRRMLLLPGH